MNVSTQRTNPYRPSATQRKPPVTAVRTACPLILLLIACQLAFAQNFSLPHAYAHNDYWHKRPLFDALENGFTHVEADVYLRRARLVVSHNPPIFRKKRTIEDLYFRPILERYIVADAEGIACHDTVVLMIDFKSRGNRTLNALNKIIAQYKPLLSSWDSGKLVVRNLTLVVTGHRPISRLEAQATRYLFVDADLKKINRINPQPEAADLFMTASCKYSSLMTWRGKGRIPALEQNRLIALVDQAHARGAKVRLWGSPDKKSVWDFLINCGVDLINTDKLVALRDYFMHTRELLPPGGQSL